VPAAMQVTTCHDRGEGFLPAQSDAVYGRVRVRHPPVQIIATTRPDREEDLRKLGATQVIDYTRNDVVTTVKVSHPWRVSTSTCWDRRMASMK
jgi:hypothetical protein